MMIMRQQLLESALTIPPQDGIILRSMAGDQLLPMEEDLFVEMDLMFLGDETIQGDFHIDDETVQNGIAETSDHDQLINPGW